MSDPSALLQRITLEPNINRGQFTVRGLRYAVRVILELLAGGMTPEEILAGYPDLELEDIQACLLYAVKLSEVGTVRELFFLVDAHLLFRLVQLLKEQGAYFGAAQEKCYPRRGNQCAFATGKARGRHQGRRFCAKPDPARQAIRAAPDLRRKLEVLCELLN